MIDTKNCAKNEVKDTERQYGLPETNEMEAERYATEDRGASYSLEFRGTEDVIQQLQQQLLSITYCALRRGCD